MRCSIKTAQVINSMLLAMGGYSFGRDVGLFVFDHSHSEPLHEFAFAGALIFFLFGRVMRRLCDNHGRKVDSSSK